MKLRFTNRITKASAVINFPYATRFQLWALAAQLRTLFIVPTEVTLLDENGVEI